MFWSSPKPPKLQLCEIFIKKRGFWTVSDIHIPHCVNKIIHTKINLFWEITVEMSQFYILTLCCLHLVTIFLYALVRRKLNPESAIPQLSWLCMSAFPVLLLVCAHLIWVLPHYTRLLSTSCWLMGNALMPSFKRIPFHPLQIIYYGIWVWSHLSALRLTVINGRFSRHQQFWEYINVSWSMDSLKCSTSTHLFALVRLHLYLDSHFHYWWVILRLLTVYISER